MVSLTVEMDACDKQNTTTTGSETAAKAVGAETSLHRKSTTRRSLKAGSEKRKTSSVSSSLKVTHMLCITFV